MSGRYDVAVLVSSDADFKHAIEVIKFETGKAVELRQVVGSRAYDLITAASVYQPITAKMIQDCLRKSAPSVARPSGHRARRNP